MSVIQRRQVLCEHQKDGVVRFHDWALVTTPIGTCAEPFCMNMRRMPENFDSFDPADDMSRIDNFLYIDMDKEKLVLSGGDHALHGGYMMPRTGR